MPESRVSLSITSSSREYFNTFKRVIVFGGAGFIGSHLLKQLARDFPSSALFSLDTAEPRFRVPGVTYLTHDVRTPVPAQLCGGAEETLIFNLAAVHTTPGHEDWEYFWTNGLGASNVCRFATEIGARHIIFTSSISVYGPCEIAKDEDSALEPNSAYGRSKLLAEKQHQCWQAEKPDDRRLTVVRPAVIYGHTERGNFTRLASLLKRGRFVYPGRKDTIKSCGYVKDLVASMLYMASRNAPVVTYNFCYPERYTSADICAAFCDVAGFQTPRFVAPQPLMLLAAFGFEILGKFGLKTSINRERIRKLVNSTNILPKGLQDAGFKYNYDLRSSLVDWSKATQSGEFV